MAKGNRKSGSKFKSADMLELTGKAAELMGSDFIMPDNENLEKILTAKRKEAEAISDDIASGKQKVAEAQAAIYRNLVAGLLAIMPIAFEEYRKSKAMNTAYGLSSVVNQLKECMAILSGLENQDAKASRISQDIIEPAIMSIAAHMITVSGPVKAAIDASGLKPDKTSVLKKAVDAMCSHHATFLQGVIEMLNEKIHIEITGNDPNVPAEVPSSKSKKAAGGKDVSPFQEATQKASGKAKKKPAAKKAKPKGKAKKKRVSEDDMPWDD